MKIGPVALVRFAFLSGFRNAAKVLQLIAHPSDFGCGHSSDSVLGSETFEGAADTERFFHVFRIQAGDEGAAARPDFHQAFRGQLLDSTANRR